MWFIYPYFAISYISITQVVHECFEMTCIHIWSKQNKTCPTDRLICEVTVTVLDITTFSTIFQNSLSLWAFYPFIVILRLIVSAMIFIVVIISSNIQCCISSCNENYLFIWINKSHSSAALFFAKNVIFLSIFCNFIHIFHTGGS